MKTFQPTFFFLALLMFVTLLSNSPKTDNTIFNCKDGATTEKQENKDDEKPFNLNDQLDEPLRLIQGLVDEGVLLCGAWNSIF